MEQEILKKGGKKLRPQIENRATSSAERVQDENTSLLNLGKKALWKSTSGLADTTNSLQTNVLHINFHHYSVPLALVLITV